MHEEHIRNDSILSVGQSKKNIYTDTRIENFHDEDRGISITGFFKYGNQYKELHEDIIRNDSIRHTSVQSKTNTKTDKRIDNSHDVVLQLSHSIADIEDSDNSQLQSSPEMYSLSFKENQNVVSIVGREIQLTKDYTTGNETFKQGSRGTVIEATSRKDGKLKVKLDNDDTKKYRLIKGCDLQLYEGVLRSFFT